MNFIPRLKWLEGRQGTGYRKMLLLAKAWTSKGRAEKWWLDSYVIHYPPGAGVPEHTDPVGAGERHYRLNVVLKKPANGGEFRGRTLVNLGGRVILIRPDIDRHSVTPCSDDRYVFSVGLVVPSKS